MVSKVVIVASTVGIGSVICLAIVLPIVLVTPKKDDDNAIVVKSKYSDSVKLWSNKFFV